jgi:chemotaxis response regulator CheB
MRRAIRRLLEEQAKITLVGEASGLARTIEMIEELKPQVIVLDLHMEGDSEPENEVVKAG